MIKRFFLHTILSFVLFFAFIQSVFALGVSPATIEIDTVLPNTEIEKTIVISRAEPTSDILTLITVYGDAAEYITLANGAQEDELLLPEGEQQVKYTFTINPGDLASGTYRARVAVNPKPLDDNQVESGMGSFVFAGSSVDVKFTVSNQEVEEYTIDDLTFPSAEENGALGFYFEMTNSGNVATRPASIELTIDGISDPDYTYSETFSASSIQIVAPQTSAEVGVLINEALVKGEYLANIIINNSNGTEIYSDTISFSVHPEGTLDQKGDLISFESDKAIYEDGETIVFESEVSNTGEIGLESVLVVEIYKGSKRMDVLESDPLYIPRGKSTSIELSFMPTESGKYQAIGVMKYGIYESDSISLEFSVGADYMMLAIAIGSAAIVLLLILVFFLMRRRRRNAMPLPPVPPTQTPPVAPGPPVPPSAPPSAPTQAPPVAGL